GTVQAAEALKLIAGVGETLAGRLLMVDAFRMEWTTMALARTPDGEVCGGHGHRVGAVRSLPVCSPLPLAGAGAGGEGN
ncbi:hypothetical protein ABTD62_22315, partial [Acinetobacter baumannii]